MRTFVLGAGSSLHVKYPLTKDLGPRLIEWAEKNPRPQNLYWIDAEQMARLFTSFDDIEGIVTELENPTPGSPVSKLSKGERGSVLAGLRNALCEFFDSIRTNDAPLYRQFANEVVQPGDTIITFNYDVSLERELRRAGKWQIDDGYGFDFGITCLPRSTVKLLKLHGSTNWIDSLFSGIRTGTFVQGFGWEPRGLRPVVPPGEFEFLGYEGVTNPQFNNVGNVGGVDRSGSMILPSRNKRFYVSSSINPRERDEFWSALWGQAADALQNADEIVIIGYSLPPADNDAQRLLLESSNKESLLTICCGQDTDRLKKEFAHTGFSHIRCDSRRFENWPATQCAPHEASLAR